MLMPSKHIKPENALIGVGAQILQILHEPKTISVLFRDVQAYRKKREMSVIHFDWVMLVLSFLYSVGLITYKNGALERVSQ